MNEVGKSREHRRKTWSLLLVIAALLLSGLSLDQGVSPAQAGHFTPTQSQFIEVIPGKLPLIIGIPHGGSQAPGNVADRQQAVIINDRYSQAAGRELASAIARLTGKRPTLVINHLDQSKLDPNRGLTQGAQGDPIAEKAWWSFHESIQSASNAAAASCSRGLYLDLHSYGGEPDIVQIGFGIGYDSLTSDDGQLSDRRYIHQSNIRSLALNTGVDFVAVVKGSASLAGQLLARGYPAVPYSDHRTGFEGSFSGGYSVYRHGSRHQGVVDALQVELPYRYLDPTQRSDFIQDLAAALLDYMVDHYQWYQQADGNYACSILADVSPQHWAYTAIDAQFRNDDLSLCSSSPRRFCPQDEISRQEAVEWLWRNIDFSNSVEPGGPVFADVRSSNQATRTLWQLDIVQACSTLPLRFCPETELIRADLAQWLLKVKFGPDYVPARPSGSFVDINQADWQDWWVEQAYHQGMLRPCGLNQVPGLCPGRKVNRAEWTWALHQAIKTP